MNVRLVAICITPVRQTPMQSVNEVRAIACVGLEGDRYSQREGSFNFKKPVDKPITRQVSIISAESFRNSGYTFLESRRNLVIEGFEVNEMIGKEFTIGEVKFIGVRYNPPCSGVDKLLGRPVQFKRIFFERGGILADVITGGMLRVGDIVVPPPRGYTDDD